MSFILCVCEWVCTRIEKKTTHGSVTLAKAGTVFYLVLSTPHPSFRECAIPKIQKAVPCGLSHRRRTNTFSKMIRWWIFGKDRWFFSAFKMMRFAKFCSDTDFFSKKELPILLFSSSVDPAIQISDTFLPFPMCLSPSISNRWKRSHLYGAHSTVRPRHGSFTLHSPSGYVRRSRELSTPRADRSAEPDTALGSVGLLQGRYSDSLS